MGKISDKMFCVIACLGAASLVGFGVMYALILAYGWTIMQGLFAAAVVWAILSVVLLVLVCGTGNESQEEARLRLQREMAEAKAKVNAAPIAPAIPTPAPKKNAGAPAAAVPKTAAPAAAPVAKAPLEPATSSPVSESGGTRPEALTQARGGKADDLKQIKGIGPKLEKLCNSLGFYHFDQIANWTADEVAWVDDNLEGFKGRVSRDKWVDQAKTLAGGGETEFSKRVEDGDVY